MDQKTWVIGKKIEKVPQDSQSKLPGTILIFSELLASQLPWKNKRSKKMTLRQI